jgi:hypothetical protein
LLDCFGKIPPPTPLNRIWFVVHNQTVYASIIADLLWVVKIPAALKLPS